MSKSARWCFTVNNPGQYRPQWDPTIMQYMIWQLERGASGTLHIQGYVRFNSPRTLAAVKNCLVCQEAHVEVANGTEEQNKEYCSKAASKEAGPFEFGHYDPSKGKKGKRTDIIELKDAIKKGATMAELAESHPEALVRYPSGVQVLRQALLGEGPKTRDVTVHILWGPTGTGKTHRVRTAFDKVYAVSPGRDPWGRYQGEDVVLFDEFDWSSWPLDRMKEYLDKWPVALDCRYMDKTARWTKVFIIANTDPRNWYSLSAQSSRDALFRRIWKITEVTSQDQDVELIPPVAVPAPVPAAPASTPVLAADGDGASSAGLARTDSVSLQDYIEVSD